MMRLSATSTFGVCLASHLALKFQPLAEMTDKTAIIAATTQTLQTHREQRGSENAPQFSYALASAGLERKAAQSLKAHGAAGKANVPAKTGQTQKDGNSARAGDSTRGAVEDAKTSQSTNQRTPNQAPSQHSANATQPLQSSGAAAQIVVSPGAGTPAIRTASLQTQTVKSIEAAGVRDAADAARTKTDATKALRQPQQAAKATETFAEIVARRLEKASSFDLRLDPPGLGHVEGRLHVQDDGKAVLALNFDKQAAYDFYSNNADALRLALTHAGLEFGSGNFSFHFRERSESSLAVENADSSLVPAVPVSLPSPVALITSRTLDIRV